MAPRATRRLLSTSLTFDTFTMILNHLYSFLIVSFIKYVNSFVWNVHDVIKPQSVITYSERYMFKTKHGPTFLQQGHSYIHLMNNIEAV